MAQETFVILNEVKNLEFPRVSGLDEILRCAQDDKIRSLNTSAEVERAYGKPSWKETGTDSLYLRYSRSPSSTHYWNYFISLDPYTNLVLDISDDFYFD